MQLQDLFRPEDIVVGFRPGDKWSAIRGLLDRLVESGRVGADVSEDLLEQVLDRERSMSTGMERGIAIPHAAVDTLPDVVAALGIVGGEEGLAFEAIDGRPTHLVVLLLIPRAQKLLHIRTLADVARVLGRAEVRDALRRADSSQLAWSALGDAEGATV